MSIIMSRPFSLGSLIRRWGRKGETNILRWNLPWERDQKVLIFDFIRILVWIPADWFYGLEDFLSETAIAFSNSSLSNMTERPLYLPKISMTKAFPEIIIPSARSYLHYFQRSPGKSSSNLGSLGSKLQNLNRFWDHCIFTTYEDAMAFSGSYTFL